MALKLSYTDHARVRKAQRAVSDEAIEAVLLYGKPWHQRKGRVALHLGRKQVEAARKQGVDLRSYENTAVVVADGRVVVTVIRTADTKRLRRCA